MAIGTISKVVPSADYTMSNKRVRVRDVQLTSGANYTTGGETITPAACGLRARIEQVNILSLATTTAGSTSRGVSVIYQTSGSVKLQVQTTASAEASSNSDQSTFTVRAQFIGI